MKPTKELNDQELNNVSGGESSLDKYLKTLVGTDKNKILVDQGTGKTLDLNPAVKFEDDNNVYIIKREKSDETPEGDL